MAETVQKSTPKPRRRSRIMTLLRWASIVVAVLIVGVVAGIVIVDRMAAANIHTPQHVDAVRYLDQGWVDGGSGLHAFQDTKPGHFGPVLIASLGATWINPAKFNRFARGVLGAAYPEGKSKLSSDLAGVVGQMVDLGVAQFRKGIFRVQG